MNLKLALTVTSLLSIVFSSFHLADDVVKGFEPGGPSNYIGIIIMAVFLLATVMLDGRRWAHAIVMLGSIGGAAVPYLHMMGSGLVGPRVVNNGGVLFWVWTMLALGATAMVSAVLAARGLWMLGLGPRRSARVPE
jgi:hypothetical protein